MLIFYLICLNSLKLKLSKIREKKRTRLGLFFLQPFVELMALAHFDFVY